MIQMAQGMAKPSRMVVRAQTALEVEWTLPANAAGTA